MNALVEAWRRLDTVEGPYIMPEDVPHVSKAVWAHYGTFSAYLESEDFQPNSKKFHLGLLPMPYVGDLENATIFLLMLNPGLAYGGYTAELDVPGTRERFVRNLQQEFGGEDYPFFNLDPDLVLHPGFGYWERKLRDIAQLVSEQRDATYRNALSFLAKRIAGLEVVPYHSAEFGVSEKVLEQMPSVQLIREYVHTVLVPRANCGQALIIVLHGHPHWRLTENQNTIVLRGGAALGAKLGPKTLSGQAIMRNLELNGP